MFKLTGVFVTKPLQKPGFFIDFLTYLVKCIIYKLQKEMLYLHMFANLNKRKFQLLCLAQPCVV